MIRHVFVRRLAPVLALVAATGCAKSTVKLGSTYIKSGDIGPEGGSLVVTAADDATYAGTSITIPPGALSQTLLITIGAASQSVTPTGGQAAGPVVDFGPDGTAFAVPVTMQVPAQVPAGATALAIEAVESDGASRRIPVQTLAGGVATFLASGFTDFGAVVPPAEMDAGMQDAGTPGTVVSGTVSLTGASSAADVLVTLSGPSSQSTTTASDGSYSFHSVPPGSYALTASAASASPAQVSATVTVADAPVTAPAFTLTALGTITGTATLGSATGNAGITVAVGGTSAIAQTNDAGEFTLTSVPVGSAEVIASLPGDASASTTVTVVYDAAVTATLTLTASAASGSIQGTVQVGQQTNVASVVLTLAGPVSGTTAPAAGGAYQFTGLPAGSYSITAVAPSTVERIQTAQITVGSGVATAAAFSFSPLGSVQGVATFGSATDNGGILVVASSAVTVTSDSGSFVLANVPAGSQTVVASSPGYSSASTTVTVPWGQAATASTLSLVSSTTMLPGGIDGNVLFAGGAAAAGVTVVIAGPTSAVAVTDSTGAYAFTDLADGQYTVTVTLPSTAEGSQSTTVSVAGAVATATTLTFTPEGAVTGKATLAGAGTPGVLVTIAGTGVSAVTDTTGTYQLRGVPAGAQTVTASSPGYTNGSVSVDVTYDTTVAASTVDLGPEPGQGGIAGTVSLSNTTGQTGWTVTLAGPQKATTKTTDGAYSFSGLLPGTYTVSATVPSTLEQTASIELSVPEAVVTAPPLSFTALGTITGTVTLDGQVSDAGILISIAGGGASTYTDTSGAFTLSNVQAGTQSLSASMSGYVSQATTIIVEYDKSVTVPSLGLTATPATGLPTITLEGTALLFDQASSAGTTVTVVGTELTATTAEDGSYSIPNVPVGTVTLQFSNGSYQETLPNVMAAQGTTGTIVGTAPGGSGTQVYVLANTPLTIYPGIRIDSGFPQAYEGTETQGISWLFSPDGQSLVAELELQSQLNGGSVQPINVLIPLSGSGPVALPGSVPPFVFSPDGATLAYFDDTGTLNALPVTGGMPATLLGPGFAYESNDSIGGGISSAWSATPLEWGSGGFVSDIAGAGTRVVVVSGGAGVTVTSVSFTGGSPATLPVDALDIEDDLEVTPDDTAVLWFDGTLLQTAPLAGGAATTLTSDPGVQSFGPTPDSQFVVYCDQAACYRQPLCCKGGAFMLPFAQNSEVHVSPGNAPHFLYVDNYQLYSLPEAGTTPAPVGANNIMSNSGYPNSSPYMIFSADGTTVCFLAAAESTTLWCAPTAGGDAVSLGPSPSQLPFFSGDGQFVVWQGTTSCLAAPVGGSPVTVLTENCSAMTPIPGTQLMIAVTGTSMDTGSVTLVDLSTVATTILTNNALWGESPVQYVAISNDGTLIAYEDATTNWLYLQPTMGGDAIAVTPLLNQSMPAFGFSGTSDQLLYIQTGSSPPWEFQDGLYAVALP